MGVEIEFLSSKSLDKLAPERKLAVIIEAVKHNKIIVLEEGLTREEERELFSRVMHEIGKGGGFTGIEIVGLGGEVDGVRASLIKMLGGKTKGLTVVGPEKLVREIKRNPEKIGFAAGK
ncbi:hypothetical protein AUJ16_01845 [Candidatus Micrarchaeota archaeon CG1_02_60_51]|nr:MAG: hypothetical protein AUJ16_01845 [Candidatus Micrarchaeota archaeon CG1_02_60_51]